MGQKDLEQVREAVRSEFSLHFDEFEKKMFEWKSEIIDTVDGMAKEIRDEREFRDVSGHQTVDNTRRIGKLEQKVFGVAES
jgi:ATP-dependent protease HslVU (ClpYQ) peptidase subunit